VSTTKHPATPVVRLAERRAPADDRRHFLQAGLAAGLSIAGLLPQTVWAQDGAPLLFAGFAFSGDYANRSQLYPHSAALWEEDKGESLDKLLREKLQQRPALASRVSLGLADGKLDQSSVAFALVQESVETQRIDGKVWVIVSLQANVLAFNKNTSSLVACYPVRMRFTRTRDTEPGLQEMRAMVRDAYTSPDPQENILDHWLARLEKVRIREGARKYLRVTEVTLAPGADQVVAAGGRTPRSVCSQVANFLEAAVAERAGIPIVPNTLGEAVGNKMAYRFADGAELQITLPSPDFALKFAVREFVSKKVERPEYFQDVFRVKGTVAIEQPESRRVVMEENVYDTLIVTRPKQANVQISDWNQYFKTLQSLVFGVGRQMARVDDAWLKDNATRGVEARQGFQSASELMKDLM
jgi:hypothetical protein